MKTYIEGNEVKKMFIAGNEVKSLFKNGVKIYDASTLQNGLILDLPLQSDFIDRTGLNTIVEGNVSGLPSFVNGAVNFLDDGKKIQTTSNIILTDKVTIAFEFKTYQTSVGLLMEISTLVNTNNAWAIFINDIQSGKIEIADGISGVFNVVESSINITNGNWYKVILSIDRSLGINQNSLFLDGLNNGVLNSSYKTDLNGNFGSYKLYIGGRSGTNTFKFNGQMKNLKIWNRILSQSEIDNL